VSGKTWTIPCRFSSFAGFAAGLALIYLFKKPEYMATHQAGQPHQTSRHRWF
jgi:hypothetical protein